MYQQPLITFVPGINPEPDETKQNTRHIIDGNNIRFRRGGVEKIGGHALEAVSTTPSGCIRSVFSFENANKKWSIIATDTKLYAKLGGTVTNITPLKTTTIALANNPLSSRYDDAQLAPLETTSGSTLVKVYTFLYDEVIAGDSVTISGIVGTAGSLNGIPIAELNATHSVVDIPGSYFRIRVTTAATSSSAPAEAASVIAMKGMKITEASHGRVAGDRIELSGVVGSVGGIPIVELNKQHVISIVDSVNTYIVRCTTTPTSFANGGGAAVLLQEEITDGECDATPVSGPWIGVPWTGLPYNIQTDTTLFVQPRIWWQDVFGDTWVGGPGQGGKCYQWLGDTDTAPTIITNAPDADWGWVEDAKLVTLLGNRVKNSDAGDYTSWTPGVASSAYEDDKEDAVRLITRAYANGENLIFDDSNKVFSMRWVGGTVKWAWKKVSNNISIAGPSACIEANGVIYVQATDNYYYYNGGILSPLPNNTLLKYIFNDINSTQRYKNFVWYNHRFNELWFHYPSASANEPDRVAIVNLTEAHWTKRESLERMAADRADLFDYPILARSAYGTYQHELGYDDNGAAMNAWLQIPYEAIAGGKVMTELSGLEPDMILTGGMSIELYGKERQREDGVLMQTFTLTENTTLLECEHEVRWRSWLWRSNEISGYFRSGGMR
jgi:hypothetical protein